MTDIIASLPLAHVMAELRRLLSETQNRRDALPFGLVAIDSHLPEGGLARGGLHEVVPEAQAAFPAAFGFIAALLARLSSPGLSSPGQREKIVLVMPAYGRRANGRPSGHGFNSLGLYPARLILVETAHRKETLWAIAEALRSAAPAAVAGFIDRLDLKLSQKLHLAAGDAGLPLLLLRPAQTLEASAAATRWRIGTAAAARDRFGMHTRARWRLHLERCRNGRPGEWVVEYDHVAHRFSLAAALADPALSCGAGEEAFGKPRRA